ncbi:cytochrome P450 [Paraburkholderia rhynchosiae]|uniref:Camphor 5-monooxygenase n=1 Tax=Paraburkholderia rhynchosiae TaxID=487049 RepID=A0A2N7WEY6_9BURK|nr:cytochrome P450 [Paraburkholderia rhynchosiae]PMS27947.1 cytochrome P450 [Paraburkholderia rhynchosiae]CAB3722352.1 Camphor 5-monooxygenase [Paraburkholderia rhynchosiae]
MSATGHAAPPESAPIPAHVPPKLVVDVDIYNPPGAGDDYHLALKRLHDDGIPDIFWTPRNGGHWIATRGDDIYQIFKDYENFSSKQLTVPLVEHAPLPPIFFDPPVHTNYRALIAPAFMPQAISKLEEKAREMAIELIEGFYQKGEVEFVSGFAQHLPIGIFMNMVALPAEDRDYLLGLADQMVRPDSSERKLAALGAIFEYLGVKIAERRANPGDDLISRIVQSRIDGRALTDQELKGLCGLVLIGGLDTVASAMGFIANFLAKSPAHRKELIEHPELTQKAVDELLRRFPVVNQGRRITHDFEYKGVQMKEGDMIIIPTTLHGLDDRKFNDPLTVDFSRPTPIHSTFGNGAHRCPGSFLARVELKVFLQEWLKRIPDFRVKAGEKAGVHGGVNGTLYHLPLEWDVR